MNFSSHSVKNFDEMLRRALMEDYERSLSFLPSEAELKKSNPVSLECDCFIKKLAQKRKHKKRIRQRLLWAAIFAVILAGFLFSQNETAMASFQSFIKEIFSIETTLTPTEQKDSTLSPSNPDIPLPKFLPKGFVQKELTTTDVIVSLVYQDSHNNTIYLDYYPLYTQLSVDNEGFQWESAAVNGYDAEYMVDSSDCESQCIWRDSEFIYTILYQADLSAKQPFILSKKDMLRMAESIYSL